MPSNFGFNDAWRVINKVVDERIRKLTRSGAGIEVTWGQVASVGKSFARTVSETAPAVYLRLDETSGSVSHDAMGGPDWTHNGTIFLGEDGLLANDYNPAYGFDSTGGEITATTNLGFDHLSIAFRYRKNGQSGGVSTGYHQIARYMRGTNGHAYVHTDGYILFQSGDATTGTTRSFFANGTSAYRPFAENGSEHSVVITYDGSFVRFYVDGEQIGSGEAATLLLAATSTKTVLGRMGNYQPNGVLDEVAIWNRALTAQEVEDIYLSESSDQSVSVYIHGNAVPSGGFEVENGLAPNVGDPVRVNIDSRGNRWIDAIIPDSTTPYPKLEIDVRNGKLRVGDGLSEPVQISGEGGVHDHDTDYSDIAHHHDADYADLVHSHTHNHDGTYSGITHNHDASYPSLSHTHRTGVFHVKDYGALGNGSADDTAEIQAAINAAVAAGGGRVYIPGGTYIISAQLTVTGQGVTIFGDYEATILRAANDISGAMIYASASHCSVERLRIEDNGFSIGIAVGMNGYSGIGASVGSALTNMWVRNVRVVSTNLGTTGIGIREASQSGVVECYVSTTVTATSDANWGIRVWFSDTGPWAGWGQDVFVIRNKVDGPFWRGINFEMGARVDRALIDGNVVTNTYTAGGAAIWSYHANQARIVNNVVVGGNHGIFDDSGEDLNTGGGLVANNRVFDCAGFGIYGEDARNSTWSGNSIRGCLLGIGVGGACRNLTITGNSILECDNGIDVNRFLGTPHTDPIGEIIISSNTIRLGIGSAILARGVRRSLLIANNILTDNDSDNSGQGHGVRLMLDTAGDKNEVVQIVGNNIGTFPSGTSVGSSGFQDSGVRIEPGACGVAVIHSNVFRGNLVAAVEGTATTHHDVNNIKL